MDKEQENKIEENTTVPLYPEPTKGGLADDHSAYGAPKQWAGGDPDKHNMAYFVAFVIFMCILFSIAVKSFTG